MNIWLLLQNARTIYRFEVMISSAKIHKMLLYCCVMEPLDKLRLSFSSTERCTGQKERRDVFIDTDDCRRLKRNTKQIKLHLSLKLGCHIYLPKHGQSCNDDVISSYSLFSNNSVVHISVES